MDAELIKELWDEENADLILSICLSRRLTEDVQWLSKLEHASKMPISASVKSMDCSHKVWALELIPKPTHFTSSVF